MTSALSGSTTEPVITKRTSSVVTTTSASASGRWSVRLAFSSAKPAEPPPT